LALTQRQPSVAPQVAFPKRVGLIVVVFAFRPPRGPRTLTDSSHRVCLLRRIRELTGREGTPGGGKGVTRACSREGIAGSGKGREGALGVEKRGKGAE
jgi:hypothetical protein